MEDIVNTLRSKRDEMQHQVEQLDSIINSLSGINGYSAPMTKRASSKESTRRGWSTAARQKAALRMKRYWAAKRKDKKG